MMKFFTPNTAFISLALLAMSGLSASAAETPSLDVNISDITTTDATVTITPSADDVTYYWSFDTRAGIEEKGGTEGIIERQIANWTRTAGYYDDTTWQDMMKYSLVSGTTETLMSDYEQLQWSTDYVVYAFGMDEEGNVTAPLKVVDFTTATPVASENTFGVKVKSMVIDSAPTATRQTVNVTVNVTPSNDDPYTVYMLESRYCNGYDLTPGSDDIDRFLSAQVLPYSKKVYTGAQTLEFPSKRVGTEFCIVTVGLDGKAPSTAPEITKFTAEEYVEEPAIVLEVSEITPVNAHIKVTLRDPEMKYYWYITTPDVIERRGGRETIDVKLDREWWLYLASFYNGTVPWQDFMRNQLSQGNVDAYAVDMPDDCPQLRWDSDYVLYAYGIDEESGERITDLYFCDFTTAGVGDGSDLTFEFEPVSVEDDPENSFGSRVCHKVTVDVYPSNDEEEFGLLYCETSVIDWYYTDQTDQTIDDYFFDTFSRMAKTFTGPVRLVMPAIREGREYYICAAGFPGYPTTDLITYKFTHETGAAGVDDVDTDGVQVKVVEGGLRIEGNYDMAAVFSVDGKVVAALRAGEGEVSLPAGVYIVKCEAAGKSIVSKVAVK